MTDLERAAAAAFDATAEHLGRPERWATATQDQRETAMVGTRAAVGELREPGVTLMAIDPHLVPRWQSAIDSILGEGEGSAE